jgi:hypothetical protein
MSAVGAVLAANQNWHFSVFVAVPVAVLFIAPFFKGWWRLPLAAQLVLIALLMFLGSIWPSLYTLAAMVTLPSFVLGIIYLVRGRAPRWGEIYILVSTLLASAALLYQGYVLATAQY